jgi:hypothetical protein
MRSFFGLIRGLSGYLRHKPGDGAKVRSLAYSVVVALVATGSAFAETVAEPVALLQGLDKITARVSQFEASVGTPVRFGTLSIRVRDCEKNPPEEEPESAAFLEIDEVRPGEVNLRVFSGWMFASSPALSALEHPVYDVNVLDCKTASGSPPVQSGKVEEKTAR